MRWSWENDGKKILAPIHDHEREGRKNIEGKRNYLQEREREREKKKKERKKKEKDLRENYFSLLFKH